MYIYIIKGRREDGESVALVCGSRSRAEDSCDLAALRPKGCFLPASALDTFFIFPSPFFICVVIFSAFVLTYPPTFLLPLMELLSHVPLTGK